MVSCRASAVLSLHQLGAAAALLHTVTVKSVYSQLAPGNGLDSQKDWQTPDSQIAKQIPDCQTDWQTPDSQVVEQIPDHPIEKIQKKNMFTYYYQTSTKLFKNKCFITNLFFF